MKNPNSISELSGVFLAKITSHGGGGHSFDKSGHYSRNNWQIITEKQPVVIF